MRKIINFMFALAAVAFLSATLNAQPVVKPKQPVVKPKSFYEGRTYTWTNANGGPVTSNLADPATDPRQIMALLKEVYTNKEIPGIWQCGYTADGKREGDIDYTVKNKDAINKAYGILEGDYKPNEEGYTTLVVTVKNSWKPNPNNMSENLDKDQTMSYIAEAIESVQILTDGVYIPATGADGNKNPNPGAVYRLSGSASRIFFMSKGRGREWDKTVIHNYAPFNGMFEEYSPVAVSNSGQLVENFYARLVNGEFFKVEHDCPTVAGKKHYFFMESESSTKKYDVTDLIVTVPDYRLWQWDDRDYQEGTKSKYTNYNKSHAPSLGLYGIQLKATATPAAGDEYTVELKWTSTLNEITGNEIDQRFKVWVRAEDGGLEPLLDAKGNQVEIAPGETFQYNYNVKQGFEGREITYVVSGQPTDALFINYKEAYSNDDKVFIPGLDPNEGLRLSIGTTSTSDYDLATETNQYKNLITIDHNLVNTHVRYDNLKVGSKLAFYRYDVDRNSKPKTIAELEIVSVNEREEGLFRKSYYLDYKYNLSFSNQANEATPKANLTGATYSLKTNRSYTDNKTNEIDFNGFNINSFNDEFCASTATNDHPATYEYKASFSNLDHSTQSELHSAYSTIKVHKTTPGLTDKAITLEDVENDNVCSTRIHKGELDASPAIQFKLDQDRRIAEYSVDKIRNKEQSESEEVGLAQRLPSWNYAIYENGSFKQNVSHTEIPQIHDASAKVGKNDYVSVIKTYRDNDGSYNTYGSPINTTYKLKASVEVNNNHKVMSEYVFTSNGKKGRYYQTDLKITAYGTDNHEIVKYRVWRQTDRAMEIVPQYMARLQQDIHPIVMNSDDEGNPSIDQNHNNIQEFELVGRPDVGFYPEQIDSKSIHVYDTFGASDVSEDGNLDVTYIVRLYAKPEAGNTSARAKATTPILAKEYYIGEATITVSFEKDTPTGLFDFVAETKTPVRVQYVNMLGQKSDTPFSGMNVVITTYTDGSHSTAKRAY